MQFMRNLSIKAKLFFMAIFVASMLLVAGGMGFIGAHRAKEAMSQVYNQHMAAINRLNEMRNFQLLMQLELISARLEKDSFEIQAYNDRVDKYIFEIGKLLQTYGAQVEGGEEKRLYDAFLAARKVMGVEGVEPMKDLLIAEKLDEAGAHFKDTLAPAYKKASYALDTLIRYQVERSRVAYEEVNRLATTTEWIAGVTTLAGLILSLALSFAVNLSITRNVGFLRAASARVAGGDLTARAGICCKDELGQVGESFDSMVDAFGALIGQVNRSSSQVSEEAQRLAGVAGEVARGSDVQIQQANAASQSATQLEHTVRGIAERLSQVVALTDQASDQTTHGRKVVHAAVEGIENVAKTVAESADMVARLGRRSDEIGRIVQVIKDIADQTNLLALNAAIEAARAGEQGRGFAVVADEVRKLAERTAKATAEISTMIQSIQSETGQVVGVMERGSKQVGEGVAMATEAGASLNEIRDAVDRVVGLIREISESSKSQAMEADQIAHRVDEIVQAAESNGTSIAQAVNTAQQMHALSQSLESSVARFRL